MSQRYIELPLRPNALNRIRCRAIVAAAVATVVIGASFVAPSQAQMIPGLERVSGFSAYDNAPRKVAFATCPVGKRVVGGGAWVVDNGQIRLTTLAPTSFYRGCLPGVPCGDYFAAIAEAPDLSDDYNWNVAAYALCVNPILASYSIVSSSTTVPSSGGPFAQASARCPSGTVAYGTGALINASGNGAAGRIGLQLLRTSNPLDISRSTARESASGYNGTWVLTSYAICAAPIQGIHAEGTLEPGPRASHTCSTGNEVIGPAGGGGLIDGGPVWLRKIFPRADLRGVDVELTGPLNPAVGGMIAGATCAQ